MPLEQIVNGGNTTTTGSVDDSSNPVVISVASAAVFPSVGNFRILIDNELLLVTSVSGNDLTCSRAQEGSTIATHANGADVNFVLTAASFRNVISEYNIYDTYSNLPTFGIAGRRFFLNPGYGVSFRDTGTAWELWHNDMGPMKPNIADFATQVNFSTRGSVDVTNGFWRFRDAGPSTNADFLMLNLKTAPSTPYTMTLVWREMAGASVGASPNMNSGIALRDSATGRIKIWAHRGYTQPLLIGNYNSATSFNAATNYNPLWNTPLRMLRVVNNGTTLSFQISVNFQDWFVSASENISGNFVANIDQIGFYLSNITSALSNAGGVGIDVYHAEVT